MACTKSKRTHTHTHIFSHAQTPNGSFDNYILLTASGRDEKKKKKNKTKKKKTTTYNIFKFVQPYPYNDLKSVIIGLHVFAS